MTISKRQHYVPQFYLRYFLVDVPNKGSVFWVYDKDGGAPRPQTPINTAVEGHLYSFESPAGAKDDLLERKVFSPLEDAAKPIFDRWQQAGTKPELEEIEHISVFLAFMHTRVPRTVEMAREMGMALYREMHRQLAKNPAKLREIYDRFCETPGHSDLPSFEEMGKYLLDPEKHFHVEVNPKAALLQMIEFTEVMHTQLLQMNWCLCDAPRDSFFVTSDTPVTMFALDNDGMAIFGGGLGLAQIEVSFPLSPKRCLLLDRQRTQSHRRVSRKVVRDLNRRTAYMSERYIIAPYKSKGVASIVAQSAFTRSTPKVDPAEAAHRLRIRGLDL